MTPEHAGRRLYDFGYVHEIDNRLRDLASLAEDEDWEYRRTPGGRPNPILYHYFHYTFERVEEQGKICKSGDNKFSCFNTGLVTPRQEPVFALFAENEEPDREPWRFFRFCTKGDHELTRFPELPDIATYFENPSCLVFDPRLEVRVNFEHIIGENRERFPDPFKSMDEHTLQMLLRGAVDNAKERVRRNYKAAVPQYHRGNVQLLLPLCLANPKVADLALVIQRHEGLYRAATCLTLDMAYNNARQLARPDADWLQP